MFDIRQPAAIIIHIFGLLIFSMDLLSQVAGRVIGIRRFCSHGPNLFCQPVVLVVLEPGDIGLGVF